MLSANQEFLLLLDAIGTTKTKILKFFEAAKGEEDFVKFFEKSSRNLFSEKEIKNIKTAILEKIGAKTAQKLEKMHISCLFIDSEDYPERLREIDCPPVILYFVGDKSILHEECIAIVGTRTPSAYGREVTESFSKALVRAGLVTVSGLAFGLDGVAASATLDAGGKTIAVLAGGLDKIYPANHTNLARRIVKSGGLLLSEYLPEVEPQKYFFLSRNRIVAGLSRGLLVAEAGKKSGTLSTVRFALDFGKEVFAIPGNITSAMSEGTNALIAEIPHCFTISPSEVLLRLGIDSKNHGAKSSKKAQNLSNDEMKIIDILYIDEKHFDELVEITQFNPKTLATLLTRMEINGLIKKLSGNFYAAVKNLK